MERITIIGLGLLGGSFAMALRKTNDIKAEITGFSRRTETIDQAAKKGIIDRGAYSIENAVRGADLVIITTPVLAIREMFQEMADYLAPGCVVTDTGSTKRRVMEWAGEFLPGNIGFIGGHPMAGKETSGLGEADADLYRSCTYCLTPAINASESAVQRVVSVVESVGAVPFFIEADMHDRLVAGVSHLPMLLSSAFVSATMGSRDWSEMGKLAAGGYKGLSRLASGNPEMNRDICTTNREEILRWLDCYIKELERYRSLVEKDGGELREALAFARDEREKWLSGGELHEL